MRQENYKRVEQIQGPLLIINFWVMYSQIVILCTKPFWKQNKTSLYIIILVWLVKQKKN